jgi:hypothetical protein
VRSAYLAAAAVHRAKRLAMVTIAYTADSDLCAASADQHHIITW